MINIEKTFKGIQPLRLGGGEPSGHHTGGMINTDKPFKGIQPFRLGGETSGYHTGGMINTENTFKGIQRFRLGGNHQVTIQADRSTRINPSRGFNPLGWGAEPSGYHTGKMINTEKAFKGIQPFRLGGGGTSGYHRGGMINTEKPSRGFNPLGWGGNHEGTIQGE